MHRQLRTPSDPITEAIEEGGLAVAACSPAIATSKAISIRRSAPITLPRPALVVAYAIAGSMRINLATEPLGEGTDGNLSIWRPLAIESVRWSYLSASRSLPKCFVSGTRTSSRGSKERGRKSKPQRGGPLSLGSGVNLYRASSLFRQNGQRTTPLTDIMLARPLASFQRYVTTDHLSASGSIRRIVPPENISSTDSSTTSIRSQTRKS